MAGMIQRKIINRNNIYAHVVGQSFKRWTIFRTFIYLYETDMGKNKTHRTI